MTRSMTVAIISFTQRANERGFSLQSRWKANGIISGAPDYYQSRMQSALKVPFIELLESLRVSVCGHEINSVCFKQKSGFKWDAGPSTLKKLLYFLQIIV